MLTHPCHRLLTLLSLFVNILRWSNNCGYDVVCIDPLLSFRAGPQCKLLFIGDADSTDPVIRIMTISHSKFSHQFTEPSFVSNINNLKWMTNHVGIGLFFLFEKNSSFGWNIAISGMRGQRDTRLLRYSFRCRGPARAARPPTRGVLILLVSFSTWCLQDSRLIRCLRLLFLFNKMVVG